MVGEKTYSADTHNIMRLAIMSHIKRMGSGIVIRNNNQLITNLHGPEIQTGSCTRDMSYPTMPVLVPITMAATWGGEAGFTSVYLGRSADWVTVLVDDGFHAAVVGVACCGEEAAADG